MARLCRTCGGHGDFIGHFNGPGAAGTARRPCGVCKGRGTFTGKPAAPPNGARITVKESVEAYEHYPENFGPLLTPGMVAIVANGDVPPVCAATSDRDNRAVVDFRPDGRTPADFPSLADWLHDTGTRRAMLRWENVVLL